MKNLTLLIPTYNRAKLLDKCLESVKYQDYKGKIHCVISNNNSNDNTSEVVKKWQTNKDFKITYINNKESLPPLENWKKTLSYVDTEYAKFLQDDDWLEKSALTQMKKDLSLLGAEVLVYNCNIISKDNNFKAVNSYYRGQSKELSQNDVINAVLQLDVAYPVSPTASIMKSDYLFDAITYGEKNQYCTKNLMGNDLIFNFMGVFTKKKTFYINKNIVNFYGGDDSISLSFNPHELSFCYLRSLLLLLELDETVITKKQKEVIEHRIFANKIRSVFDNRLRNIKNVDNYKSRPSLSLTTKYFAKKILK